MRKRPGREVSVTLTSSDPPGLPYGDPPVKYPPPPPAPLF